jgi:gamma-tubulin complex component 3
MIHFIRQLEAYCRLEVIECSWNALIDFLNRKEGDLDALIDSHCTYLDRMTKKILLWNSKPGKEVCTTNSLSIFPVTFLIGNAPPAVKGDIYHHFAISRSLSRNTSITLYTILINCQDNFYNYCLTEATRKDQALDAERVSLQSTLLQFPYPSKRVYTRAISSMITHTREMHCPVC